MGEIQSRKELYKELCRLYDKKCALSKEVKELREKDEYKNKRMEEYAKQSFEAMNERDAALEKVKELEAQIAGQPGE